jgi:hypothetical protein
MSASVVLWMVSSNLRNRFANSVYISHQASLHNLLVKLRSSGLSLSLLLPKALSRAVLEGREVFVQSCRFLS